MKRKYAVNVCAAAVFVGLAVLAAPGPAKALNLNLKSLGKTAEDLLKGAAIAALTQALADEINDIINTFTLNNNVPVEADTKVVPIISVGQGIRVGAAQVTGPADQVAKVKAVMHLETRAGQKNLMIDVFVPTDALNPLNFQRVGGVGVSALVNFRLSGL